jgi:hypothetical protein
MSKRPTTITADAYQRLLQIQAEREAKARKRKPQAHPEHDLQVACVAWFRKQYPTHAAMLFAVPNGGRRGKVEAALLKAEGVLPGVADLILLEARGGYGALCIEMKTRRRGSGQSDYQRDWQAEAEAQGNKYVITRDQAAFCREVTAYLRLPRTSAPTVVQVTGEELNRAEMAANLAKKAKF